MRFGLKDVNELPSMEEFEKLVAESFQSDLLPAAENGAAPAGNDQLDQGPSEPDTEPRSAVSDETAEIEAFSGEEQGVHAHTGTPEK
jgi:segregation and condensation protein B